MSVKYSINGRLFTPLTHGPSTYKIPASGDAPLDFRVELLSDAREDKVVGGSKAVGEPPFMLAISVVTALRAAIGSLGPSGAEVSLSIPATPESILRAVRFLGMGTNAMRFVGLDGDGRLAINDLVMLVSSQGMCP